MIVGFEVVAAKPRKGSDEDAPRQVPMRSGQSIRTAPSTDQKKVRRAMTRGVRKSAASTIVVFRLPGEGAGDLPWYVNSWAEVPAHAVGATEIATPGPDNPTHGEDWEAQPYTASHTSAREVQILRAMAIADPREQVLLAADLERLRSGRTASLRAERDIDLADTIVRAHLTPVATHVLNTSGTDWLSTVASASSEGDPTMSMKTEAAVWFGRVSADVKADRDEFRIQARGMARRLAGKHGEQMEAAERAFLDHVAHLHQADASQNGLAESTVTDYATNADQDPLYAEDWDNQQADGVHPAPSGAGPQTMPGATPTSVDEPQSGDDRTATRKQGERDFDFTYEADPEEPGSVVVYLTDLETGEVVDSMGGVEVDHQVSDHGNTNASPDAEKYIKEQAQELAEQNGGRLAVRRRTAAMPYLPDQVAREDDLQDLGQETDDAAAPFGEEQPIVDWQETRFDQMYAGENAEEDFYDDDRYASKRQAVVDNPEWEIRGDDPDEGSTNVLISTESTPEGRDAAIAKAKEDGYLNVTSTGGTGEKKESAKTASTYCPNHGVYVGEGNQEQHDHCSTEQRETKGSSKVASALGDIRTLGDVAMVANLFGKDSPEFAAAVAEFRINNAETFAIARRTAATDTKFDFEKKSSDQNGNAESNLDDVEVGDEDDRPLFPWEIGKENPRQAGLNPVTAAFAARVQASLGLTGN